MLRGVSNVPVLLAGPPVAGWSLWLDRLIAGALWQDAARTMPAAIGNPVGSWYDPTTGLAATQATAGNRPAVTATGVAFTRATPHWLTHSNIAPSAYTLYIVAQRISDTVNTRYVIGGSSPTCGLLFFPNNPNVGLFDGSVVRSGAASNQNKLAVWIADQLGEVYENTIQIATGANMASLTLTTIGRRGDGQFPFDSEIRCCLYYPTTHDAAQRATVVAWLAARHGVTL